MKLNCNIVDIFLKKHRPGIQLIEYNKNQVTTATFKSIKIIL